MVHDLSREDGEPSPLPDKTDKYAIPGKPEGDIRRTNPTGCLGCGGPVAWKFLYCDSCVRDGVLAKHRAALPPVEPLPLVPEDAERVARMKAAETLGRQRMALAERLVVLACEGLNNPGRHANTLLDGFQVANLGEPFIVRAAVRQWGAFGSSTPPKAVVEMEMTLSPEQAEAVVQALIELRKKGPNPHVV